MFCLSWLFTFPFLLASTFMIAQDYGYKNSSIRLGLGTEYMLSEDVDPENYLNSIVLYGGFQFRKLGGRLRIIPAMEINYANFRFDRDNSIDIVGTSFSLSSNYDFYRRGRSSLFMGVGGELRTQSMFLQVCQDEMGCEYVKLGGSSGGAFNFEIGYRFEEINSRVGYEFRSRISQGEVGQFVQFLVLIDLKLK